MMSYAVVYSNNFQWIFKCHLGVYVVHAHNNNKLRLQFILLWYFGGHTLPYGDTDRNKIIKL